MCGTDSSVAEYFNNKNSKHDRNERYKLMGLIETRKRRNIIKECRKLVILSLLGSSRLVLRHSLIGRKYGSPDACARVPIKTYAFDICIRNESTCGVACHLRWMEVYFRTRSELLTREVTVSRSIACYAFVHVRGANEGFMEITQVRLFRLTVNARFVVVVGRPAALYIAALLYIGYIISFLNVIVVVKETGIYLPENLSG